MNAEYEIIIFESKGKLTSFQNDDASLSTNSPAKSTLADSSSGAEMCFNNILIDSSAI